MIFANKKSEIGVGDQVYYKSEYGRGKCYGIVRHIGKLPLRRFPKLMAGENGCIWSEWEKEWDGQINAESLGWMPKDKIHKVEGVKMSKYQQLKERIKNVKGWGKEADDIISEMRMKDAFSIDVKMCWNEYKNSNEGYMEAYLSGEDANPFKEFHFKTQCEKLEAFKLALLWLLDHSDIKKDENHIKIMQLKVRKSIVCSEIVSLNKQIAELEK